MGRLSRKELILLMVCGLGTGLVGPRPLSSSAQSASGIVTLGERVVAEGSVVRLEYTMRDDAGAVLDASTEGEPLVFTQGEHQIIIGLERAVAGMGVGEESG